MRHDPATRVLSLSFERKPHEHADVMMQAARRMVASPAPASPWPAFFLVIGLGIAIGVVTEAYRRLVLPLVLGPGEVAPPGAVVLQLLPLLLILAAIGVTLYLRAAKRRQQALVSHIRPGLFVDVDIYPDGIVSASDRVSIDVDWLAVRAVVDDGGRLELECETFTLYIPRRAFASSTVFAEGAATIRRLWRDALQHDRDSRMIETGLD